MRTCLILFVFISLIYSQQLKQISPQQAGLDEQQLKKADLVIEQAINDSIIPGAVLLVMKDFNIVYKKAYGHRQIYPDKKPMTTNTLFDMASITKPVVTATSFMLLLENGAVRLYDKVNQFLEGFEPYINPEDSAKTDIRMIHLLTHTSGLPAYAHPDMLQETYGSNDKQALLNHIYTVKRHSKPGTNFVYSCLNFVTLQQIIEKISGLTLNEFAEKNIFKPLKMDQTVYEPQNTLLTDCAPTEVINNSALLGTVHDPLARVSMQCVSGNAGLFSTANDLAIFAAMMLNKGSWHNSRILSPAGINALTSLPENYEDFGRGLGWDLNSGYASNQGDLLSKNTYGHTGYTGTSFVVDPDKKLLIILLTNRVHPFDKGSVVALRSYVSNIVAAALTN